MKASELALRGGDVVRVYGPATVIVLDGALLAVGMVLEKGSRTTIPAARAYAFKALKDSKVQVVLGEGGDVKEGSEEEDLIDSLDTIARSLVGRRVVLVVGPVDTGKSTLTSWIANRCLGSGIKPGVMDTDVGQNELAYPTTVSLALLREPCLALHEVEADAMCFVGHVTPQPVLDKWLSCVHRLAAASKKLGAEELVVNTDGWVYGVKAASVKAALAEVVEADVAVVTEPTPDEVKRALEAVVEVIEAPVPRAIRSKSRSERRGFRERLYFKAFEGSKRVVLSLDEVKLLGARMFTGKAVEDELRSRAEQVLGVKVLHCEDQGDQVVVVVERKPRIASPGSALRALFGKRVRVLRRGFERGLLLGLLDDEGLLVSLGYLESIVFDKRELIVRAKPEASKARAVDVGFIRLTEDFEEQEKLEEPPL